MFKWIKNADGKVVGCMSFSTTKQLTDKEFAEFQERMKDAKEFKDGEVISILIDTENVK